MKQGEPPVPTDRSFHLLLLSNLVPQHGQAQASAEDISLQAVDRNSFASILKKWSPELVIDVPNRIGSPLPTLELHLSFPDMQSFHPEGIVKQVPALTQLLALRDVIREFERGGIDPKELPTRLMATGVDQDLASQFADLLTKAEKENQNTPPAHRGPASRDAKGRRIDSLLDMIDSGAEEDRPSETPQGLAENLIALVSPEGPAAQSASRKPTRAGDELITGIETCLNDQLNEVLHHPRFKSLETS